MNSLTSSSAGPMAAGRVPPPNARAYARTGQTPMTPPPRRIVTGRAAAGILIWVTAVGAVRGGTAQDVADLSESPCLAKPDGQITVVPPGKYTEGLRIRARAGHTYDLRGTFFYANPPKFPLVLLSPAQGACIVGPRVQGQQSRELSWMEMKTGGPVRGARDGDGIHWTRPTGRVVIDGAWIDNVEDAIGPPKSPQTSREASWVVRHVYARYIRDDFIENDSCLNGEIYDTLVDGTYVFISARPGRGKHLRANPVTKIRRVLVHLRFLPDPRPARGPRQPGKSVGQLFKWSDCGGRLDMKDCILRVDGMFRRGPRPMSFPPGVYENVTLVWLGEGDYPGALPPEGVMVTKDVRVWEVARAKWLKRHGCDQHGNNCAYLRRRNR